MKLGPLSVPGLLLLIAACADPPATNYQAPVYYPPPTPTFSASSASLQLKQHMTEEDVVRTLGSQPVSTSLSTCGTALNAAPWHCKTMEYRDSPYGLGSKLLTIVLQQNSSTGVWVVNGWRVL
jgi:hypothetical protein